MMRATNALSCGDSSHRTPRKKKSVSSSENEEDETQSEKSRQVPRIFGFLSKRFILSKSKIRTLIKSRSERHSTGDQSSDSKAKRRKKSRSKSASSVESVIYLGKLRKRPQLVVIEDSSDDEYKSKLRKVRSYYRPTSVRQHKTKRKRPKERNVPRTFSTSW